MLEKPLAEQRLKSRDKAVGSHFETHG